MTRCSFEPWKQEPSRTNVRDALVHARPGFETLESRLLLSGAKPNEVEMVWLLNQARANPKAYAIATKQPAAVKNLLPQQPLTISANLTKSARNKSLEMARHDYFAHRSAVTGLWPNQVAQSFGFQLPAAFPKKTNNIESLYGGFPASVSGALDALIRDKGINPPGHRIHLLATNDFFAKHTEVGVGYARNKQAELQNYFTIHTAYRSGPQRQFLTGVVYKDRNKNRRFDAGEGVQGVKVMVDGKLAAKTRAAGDYRVRVNQGRHKISFIGKSFTAKKTKRIFNIKSESIAYDAAKLRGRQKTYVNFKGTRFADSKPLPGQSNSGNAFVFRARALNPLGQAENQDGLTLSVLPVLNQSQ